MMIDDRRNFFSWLLCSILPASWFLKFTEKRQNRELIDVIYFPHGDYEIWAIRGSPRESKITAEVKFVPRINAGPHDPGDSSIGAVMVSSDGTHFIAKTDLKCGQAAYLSCC